MNAVTTINELLDRRDTWRGSSHPASNATLSTGQSGLDHFLLGGWPLGAITELMAMQRGIGELRLLFPTLATATEHWQVWIDPPYLPNAPCLYRAGLPLRRQLIVEPKTRQEWLAATVQSLRSGALVMAWCWRFPPSYTDLRKLQLAASTGSNACLFLYREAGALQNTSPARLRLQLSADDKRLQLQIIRLRGRQLDSRLSLAL